MAQAISHLHSALNLEEIRLEIFHHLEVSSLSVICRTCKDWNPIATKLLWGEEEIDICDALCLLAPVVIRGFGVDGPSIAFTSDPAKECWNRFKTLASLVQRLRVDVSLAEDLINHIAAFGDPREAPLFPNLRFLRFIEPPENFMHRTTAVILGERLE